MDEDDSRAVLLIKAIEDNDARQEVLPAADRRWATREAAPPEDDGASGRETDRLSAGEASFLARRARLLRRMLDERFPFLAKALAATRWRGWAAGALAAASFALGLASNELGASRHVNILAFPLLGMLAWNAVVYALLLVEAVRGWTRDVGAAAPAGPWVRLVGAGLTRASDGAARAKLDERLAGAVRAYLAQWASLAAGLYSARVRRVLHVCAALLAAGAVAGLYLRGIAFEYRAGWESTFLDAGSVHALVQAVLGPAAAVTGIALPDEAGIAALRWTGSGSGGDAALWIHLYAATALLFIVLPRIALALWERSAELRLRRDFPLPADLPRYCRNVLAALHAHERSAVADVVAGNCTLSNAAVDVLALRLQEKTGQRIAARLLATVPYGEEDGHVRALRGAGRDSDYVVLVFNMSATPEEENHGLLLHGYRGIATDERPLIVVLDESAYRRRLEGQAGADARLAERRAAWARFAQSHGVELVPLDLDATAAEART